MKAGMERIDAKSSILPVDDILDGSRQSLIRFPKIGGIVDARNPCHAATSGTGGEKMR